jgi:hypothetical protein
VQDDPAGRIREQEKHAMAYRIKWFGIRIDLTSMRISAQGEGKGVGLVERLVSRSPGMPYSGFVKLTESKAIAGHSDERAIPHVSFRRPAVCR